MLPAQPPNSRRSCGTRNETFSMWILSGRMCCLKRPSNTMMVSKAIEPQISAFLDNDNVKFAAPVPLAVASAGLGGGKDKGFQLHTACPDVAGTRRAAL